MDPWFTVEEIDRQTFCISEYKHWEETHCYLLCGQKRAALIDTGLGVSNIRQTVCELTALPVTVVTTHCHWDHIGGHGLFSSIAVHQAERSWLSDAFPLLPGAVKKELTKYSCRFPDDFSLDSYSVFHGEPQILLQDGDILDLGNRALTVIHTPGHSPGHCCFYEPDRKLLFSGDLIYCGCLEAFYPSTDPRAYWESVRRVQALPVDRILPGHHQLELSISMVDEVAAAFSQLEQCGKLIHGSGQFDFGRFQIHL